MNPFHRLLDTPSIPSLGPDPRPGTESLANLGEKLDSFFKDSAAAQLPDRNRQLIRALVFLWHDHLDAAHSIAQEVEGSDGAFVHGIMHRREPDYGNAAYWFRRVNGHPAFPTIAERAVEISEIKSNPNAWSSLFADRGWDPFAFIRLCERFGRSSGSEKKVLQEIQAIETCALLERLSLPTRQG